MKIVINNVFETNSSSTHSITVCEDNKKYKDDNTLLTFLLSDNSYIEGGNYNEYYEA